MENALNEKAEEIVADQEKANGMTKSMSGKWWYAGERVPLIRPANDKVPQQRDEERETTLAEHLCLGCFND